MNRRTKLIGVGGFAALVAASAVPVIQHFESGGKVYTTSYRDLGGVWTICDGRTEGVTRGMTQTEQQCNDWLQKQVVKEYAEVKRCIKPDLTLGQAVALTDAVHNLGTGVVCGSTLQRLANTGKMDYACMQLVDAKGKDGLPIGWTRVDNRYTPGLLGRRETEVILCLKGMPQSE